MVEYRKTIGSHPSLIQPQNLPSLRIVSMSV